MRVKLVAIISTACILFMQVQAHAEGHKVNNLIETEQDAVVELLATCVEAEAGNQDLKGKQLVADVILNRVDSDRFPDDVESVITQKYHFSTYWDGSMDNTEPSDEAYEAVCMELVERLDDEILFFSAGGYSKYCKPAYQYGDHYFGY